MSKVQVLNKDGKIEDKEIVGLVFIAELLLYFRSLDKENNKREIKEINPLNSNNDIDRIEN